ncbi:outer membrane lipoprotein carrier protein LolA [uncultured Jatrophihabitans sp.]|uniref:LolA family protein n=1 Tax=uncultured Jatrophihabitans sp. TaxID=1610747 RepID=UPI0035CBEF2C
MNVPSVLTRHRALRWLVPAGIGGIVAVASVVLQTDTTQSRGLPRMTPAALLADVQAAPTTGFSGTVLSRVSLGLPELPSLGGGSGDRTPLTALLSGSHTVQVWYGGADEQRVALLGALDETDIFRSGRQLWLWNSSDRVAQHAVLPARPASDPIASAAPTVSPSALASQVLAAVSPTTQVQVRTGERIADRNAYELTLTPRTSATRVASVQISVDASTKLPLAVRVYARGSSSPSIDVAFTSVRFTAPATTFFTFSPPSGAAVRPLEVGADIARMVGTGTRVVGSGWTRVVELDTRKAVNVSHGELKQLLTPVSGRWGSGGLLQSSLVSVLVTSKGRIFAGAVDPAALYAAAAK